MSVSTHRVICAKEGWLPNFEMKTVLMYTIYLSLSLSLQNEGKNANVSGLETAELNNMPPHIACFLNMSDKISSHLFSFWCTLAFSVVEVIEFASRACWQARHTRQKTIKLNSQTLCGSNLCLKGSGVNPTTHCLQSSQEFHATSYGEICSAEYSCLNWLSKRLLFPTVSRRQMYFLSHHLLSFGHAFPLGNPPLAYFRGFLLMMQTRKKKRKKRKCLSCNASHLRSKEIRVPFGFSALSALCRD